MHVTISCQRSNNYPKSGSWTGEVRGFWDAGQGATTRNATAQGGAVPSAGRCDPEAGCGRPMNVGRRRGSPALPDPRFAGPLVRRFGAPFHSKNLQRSHVPKKRCNSPVADSPG
ncbi:MAG: hypothetical protein ABIT23_02075, partial [Nitrosospira sp.]